MAAYGVPWSRVSVEKLENGRRGSITVQELMALALVLGVPPLWLLVDVRGGEVMPIATDRPDGEPDVNADPWTAYLWMAGRRPLEGAPDYGWTRVNGPIEAAFAFATAVDNVRQGARMQELIVEMRDSLDSAEEEAARDRREAEQYAERDRRALGNLKSSLTTLQRAGMALPPVPADVRRRADELGVDLSIGNGA